MKVIKSRFVLTHKFEDAEFDFQALAPGDVHEITDLCLRRKFVHDDNGKPDTIVEYDFLAERRENAARALIGWRGVQDESGVDVPFSIENTFMLMRYVDGFYEFVRDSITATSAAKAKHDADLQKN